MQEERDWEYDCATCGHKMTLRVSEAEMQSSLLENRQERCPNCGQSVGTGMVRCFRCKTEFTVELPHWHDHCDLASGTCPNCGSEYISGCIC